MAILEKEANSFRKRKAQFTFSGMKRIEKKGHNRMGGKWFNNSD